MTLTRFEWNVITSIFSLLQLLENNDWEEIQTLEIPDASDEIVSLLLEVIYNGVVEATIQDLRDLILLGHSLYIAIPMSDDLMEGLDLVSQLGQDFSAPETRES